MKPYVLERRESGRIEQVSFYDEFYTHYIEEDGKNTTVTSTYEKAGTSKLACIRMYQEEGFGESNDARQ